MHAARRASLAVSLALALGSAPAAMAGWSPPGALGPTPGSPGYRAPGTVPGTLLVGPDGAALVTGPAGIWQRRAGARFTERPGDPLAGASVFTVAGQAVLGIGTPNPPALLDPPAIAGGGITVQTGSLTGPTLRTEQAGETLKFFDARIAVDPSGHGVLSVADTALDACWHIRSPDGAWGACERPPGGGFADPSVAVNERGDVWTVYDGRASYRPAGGTFSDWQAVPPPGNGFDVPHEAYLDAAGNGITTVLADGGIVAVRRAADGTLSAEIAAEGGAGRSLAASSDGRLLLAWVEQRPAGGSFEAVVLARRGTIAGGLTGAPIHVATIPGAGSGAVSAAISRTGRAIVGWDAVPIQPSPAPAGAAIIEPDDRVSRAPLPSGRFSGSFVEHCARAVRIGMTDAGGALVAYAGREARRGDGFGDDAFTRIHVIGLDLGEGRLGQRPSAGCRGGDSGPAAPPRVGLLRVVPAAFAPASRARTGAAIRFRLDRAGSVRLSIFRRSTGVQLGGRCIPPAGRAGRNAPSCVRLVLAGGLRARGDRGLRTLRFGGWAPRRAGGAHRRLARGRYVVVARGVAGGRLSPARRATFRIR